MTPSDSSRKRKAAADASTTRLEAAMKRLRQTRGAQQDTAGSRDNKAQPRRTKPKTASSSSSTPTASQSRVSPLASSSVAGGPDDESADSLSDVPSSLDAEDEDIEMPTNFNPRSSRTSVQTLRTKFSEQWRNATRVEANKSGAKQSTTNPSSLILRPSGYEGKAFLELPRELRDQIYRELYVHDGAIAIRQPKFHLPVLAHPRKPLSLSRTNHQIYEEVMKIFIGENDFILAQNILSAIDFLGAMPQILSKHFTSITLGKTIMSGYVRYELGMFDSSRLRADLVKRLVYEWNLKTISIEVPDEHNPNAPNNGGNGNAANGAAGGNNWFNLSTFHPRHDYSWSLMREIIDVLLESGFDTLRLVYATPLSDLIPSDPKRLLSLYAISRILYLDDEFEVETQVKRIEMARLAGRRDEFENKAAVEKYVRARRQVRRFCVGVGKKKHWETGSVVVIKRTGEGLGGGKDGMWDVNELMMMPGAMESLSREL